MLKIFCFAKLRFNYENLEWIAPNITRLYKILCEIFNFNISNTLWNPFQEFKKVLPTLSSNGWEHRWCNKSDSVGQIVGDQRCYPVSVPWWLLGWCQNCMYEALDDMRDGALDAMLHPPRMSLHRSTRSSANGQSRYTYSRWYCGISDQVSGR